MSGDICYNCFKEKTAEGKCPHCGYDSRTQAGEYPLALPPGTILDGRYIVGRVLGQGGFGATYIAQEYSSKQLIAIKEFLPTDFVTRSGTYDLVVFSEQHRENFESGKQLFLNEAKTLAKVKGDPNVVDVYGFFEEHNTAYFTMEFVQGRSLQQVVKEHGGRLSVDEANRLLLPVMRAVGVVHSKGIVHRDIAPDNIMITEASVSKLIDFGAARLDVGEKSRSLDVMVKHGFAPKEQYTKNGHQGPYTDVYAMAATYYYSITGKVPPDAIERIELDQLIRPSALGAEIEPEAEMVLLKALAINAKDRYQTMEEFVKELSPAPEIIVEDVDHIDMTTPESMLKKAADYLKQGDWAKAELYLNVVLSEDPQNAEAWVGKLLVEQKAPTIDDLADRKTPFHKSKSFCMALENADPGLKKILQGYIPETKNPLPEFFKKLAKHKKALIASLVVLLICAGGGVAFKMLSGHEPDLWEYESGSGTLALHESMDSFASMPQEKLPWAEYKNEIRTITIGDGVQSVPSGIFKDYPSVSKVNIRNGVDTVGASAFQGCRSLKTLYLADSVTAIEAGAFSGCSSLDEITMSSAIRTIGVDAFSGCPDSLQLYYGGTDDYWQNVKVSSGNETLESAYYTMISSSANLVFAKQEVKLEASTDIWNSTRLDVKLLPDQVYTLCIDQIKVLSGSTDRVTIGLFDPDANHFICKENVSASALNYVFVFNTPSTLSKNAGLFVMAGLHGKADNISVAYRNIRLYEGLRVETDSKSAYDDSSTAVQMQQTTDILTDGANQYSGRRVASDLAPGKLYTVSIKGISVLEGNPKYAEVLLRYSPDDLNLRSDYISLSDKQTTHNILIYTQKDLSAQGVLLVVYGGQYGATQGIKVKFDEITVYEGAFLDD